MKTNLIKRLINLSLLICLFMGNLFAENVVITIANTGEKLDLGAMDLAKTTIKQLKLKIKEAANGKYPVYEQEIVFVRSRKTDPKAISYRTKRAFEDDDDKKTVSEAIKYYEYNGTYNISLQMSHLDYSHPTHVFIYLPNDKGIVLIPLSAGYFQVFENGKTVMKETQAEAEGFQDLNARLIFAFENDEITGGSEILKDLSEKINNKKEVYFFAAVDDKFKEFFGKDTSDVIARTALKKVEGQSSKLDLLELGVANKETGFVNPAFRFLSLLKGFKEGDDDRAWAIQYVKNIWEDLAKIQHAVQCIENTDNPEEYALKIIDLVNAWSSIRSKKSEDYSKISINSVECRLIESKTLERLYKFRDEMSVRTEAELRKIHNQLQAAVTLRKEIQSATIKLPDITKKFDLIVANVKKPGHSTQVAAVLLKSLQNIVWQSDPFNEAEKIDEILTKYNKTQEPFNPLKIESTPSSPQPPTHQTAKGGLKNWHIAAGIGGAAIAALVWKFRNTIRGWLGRYQPLPKDPKHYNRLVEKIRIMKQDAKSEEEFNDLSSIALQMYSPADREKVKNEALKS